MQTYNYEDEDGTVLYRVVRYGKDDKQFKQEHPNGNGWARGRGVDNNYPYRLPEVLAAIDAGQPIWIMEGEKDVETARLNGLVATTNSGGGGKWNNELSNWLRGAEPVYIVWDRDDKGARHALSVEASLRALGIGDIRFRRAATGNDFTDHIEAGLEPEALLHRRPKPKKQQEADEDAEVEDVQFLPAAFQLALNKLNKVTPEYGKQDQYNALCPAHDDSSPSLSIRPGDDVAVLVHCHTGCSTEDIARALGMNPIEFTAFPGKRERDSQEWHNEQAYMRKLANRHADQRIKKETARTVVKFGDRDDTGKDELAKPLEPVKWLIDGWFRYSSAVLVNADPKAGKTRIALNLMQALSENEPFLGKFQTNWPDDARIWYGNWDMPEDLMREYLHDYTWRNPERFIMQHISTGEFPFWIPEVFDDFTQYALRMNVQMMIVDTLHVAGQGYVTDENSNDEVSEFVHLLRKLCKAAAIPHLLVVHHTGHSDKKRGRGASTLAADFDGIWNLRMEDQENHGSPRSLGARGRKLGQSPIELVYDVATEVYSTEMRSAKEASNFEKFRNLCSVVHQYYQQHNSWPSTGEARTAMSGAGEQKTDVMLDASGRGFVKIEKVQGKNRKNVILEKKAFTVFELGELDG